MKGGSRLSLLSAVVYGLLIGSACSLVAFDAAAGMACTVVAVLCCAVMWVMSPHRRNGQFSFRFTHRRRVAVKGSAITTTPDSSEIHEPILKVRVHRRKLRRF